VVDVSAVTPEKSKDTQPAIARAQVRHHFPAVAEVLRQLVFGDFSDARPWQIPLLGEKKGFAGDIATQSRVRIPLLAAREVMRK